MISLLSINGEMIRQIGFKYEIDKVISFKSYKGFDYLVLATVHGKIYFCEAYTLSIGKSIMDVKDEVGFVDYNAEQSMLVVVTKRGDVIRKYYELVE